MNKTVAVALSGGLDSSVTALLLKKEGYNVIGVTAKTADSPEAELVVKNAKAAADKLEIPFYSFDTVEVFNNRVIKYFENSYKSGETPNPCIMCNKHIKLGLLADYARKQGADIIVTGHYAEIRLTSNGVELHRAQDLSRDQSYFLFDISKQNLQMLRCPLATYSKEQTRAINDVQAEAVEIQPQADAEDYSTYLDTKQFEAEAIARV